MFTSMCGDDGLPKIPLTISANTNNYNLFSAAGSPTYPAVIVVTINSGIEVGSTSTGSPSFTTGTGWNAATTLKLINNGNIHGQGGNGGGSQAVQVDVPKPGYAGAAGGDALDLGFALSLDNSSGNIYGGGGGGGGGGAAHLDSSGSQELGSSGGGGGGGASDTNTSGGSAGGFVTGITDFRSGTNGGAGSSSGGGGGTGGNWSSAVAGNGGSGGGWGSAGSAGGAGVGGTTSSSGGGAGAAGKAVDKNGNTLTWLGGNNGTQVKGAVS